MEDERPSRYKEQLTALQGIWAEQGTPEKCWLVEGTNVTQLGAGRHFTLHKGEHGGLVWGTKGQFMLEPRFPSTPDGAAWLADGEVRFAWTFVCLLKDLRRIDPTDGNAYTFKELSKHYAATYTFRQTEEYWKTLEVAVPSRRRQEKSAPGWQQHEYREPERRIDEDGGAYTWEEMWSRHGGSERMMQVYWNQCEVAVACAWRPKGKGKCKNPEKGYFPLGAYAQEEAPRHKGSGQNNDKGTGKGREEDKGKSKGKYADKGKGKDKVKGKAEDRLDGQYQ